MSVRRPFRLAGRLCLSVLVVSTVVAVLGVPGPAVGSALAQTQGNGTVTAGNATGNGSQIETAASEAGDGGGGILDTALGLVGGIAWAVLGFLDSSIGHALVGIPLGIYLGLKAIALYLEYYD